MALKGLKKIWKPSTVEIIVYSCIAFNLLVSFNSYISKLSDKLSIKKDINLLFFHLPLIIGVALLSFMAMTWLMQSVP